MRKIGQPRDLKKFKLVTPKSEPNLVSDFVYPNAHPIVTRFTSGENKITVTGYMCAIDWQHEIGNASDGNTVYPSVEALKHHHDCWEECGIVEVEVTIKKTVAPSKY